jgi:hypothetical protein
MYNIHKYGCIKINNDSEVVPNNPHIEEEENACGSRVASPMGQF